MTSMSSREVSTIAFSQTVALWRCARGVFKCPVLNYHSKEMPQCSSLVLNVHFSRKYQHVVTFRSFLLGMEQKVHVAAQKRYRLYNFILMDF